MVTVDPEVYYAAAKACHKTADDVASQVGLLRATLMTTGGMAGDYPAVLTWSTDYGTHAQDFIQTACTLANALENFSDILNVAGHNWAIANYNANRDPNKGPAPIAPARSPGPVARDVTVRPPSATGTNGDGLDTNIDGLLAAVGVPIPNGDTSKLGKAAAAWKAFATHDSIAKSATTIHTSHDSFANVQAPDAPAIQGHLATLKSGAESVVTFADQLGSTIASHHGALDDLRTDIDSTTKQLLVEIGVATAIGVLAVVAMTAVTAGAAALGPDEAAAGLTVAEVAALVTSAGRAIRTGITGSRLITAVLAVGGAAAFGKVDGVTVAGALHHIAMLTAQTIGEPDSTESRGHRAAPGPYVSPEPGTPEYMARVDELSKDPAKGGVGGAQARREAEVALQAERQGLIDGPVSRAPHTAEGKDQGDFRSPDGQLLDVKSSPDQRPSYADVPGKPIPKPQTDSEFEDTVERAFGKNQKVLLDTDGMTVARQEHIRQLVEQHPEWKGKILWGG